MYTSYNEIWETFLQICGYDSSEIPQTDARRYILIQNGIKLYNQKANKYENRIQSNLIGDNVLEQVNKKLSDVEILILANIIASVITKNKYTEFTSVWGVFAKETGFKDYRVQCQAREYTIQMFENEVDRLIEDEIDSFEIR